MLLLTPPPSDPITFSTHTWRDVLALAVDRLPKRIIEDYSDTGPFPTFADVPEQSIAIRIIRRIAETDPADLSPRASGILTFYLSPPGADLARRKVTIPCVLTSIRTELPTPTKPATRTLTLLATSEDGTDPVTIEPPIN